MAQTEEERKAKKQAWGRAWYAANREKCCARSRASGPTIQRARTLRKFNLTEDLWNAILESQGEACPCGVIAPGGRGTWHIDHDHTTGRVRGLLCHHCNTGLGKLGDDYDIAIQRIEALRAQSERTAARLYPPR